MSGDSAHLIVRPPAPGSCRLCHISSLDLFIKYEFEGHDVALPDLLPRALAGQSTLPSLPTCATATPIRPATSLVRCGIPEVTISTDAAQSAASACAACPAPARHPFGWASTRTSPAAVR